MVERRPLVGGVAVIFVLLSCLLLMQRRKDRKVVTCVLFHALPTVRLFSSLLPPAGSTSDEPFRLLFFGTLRGHIQIRVLKKCPELVEDFIERVVVLLVERSHGVVLCGVQVRLQNCRGRLLVVGVFFEEKTVCGVALRRLGGRPKSFAGGKEQVGGAKHCPAKVFFVGGGEGNDGFW